ncbi:MAG TPA: DNA polymerase/3'-5' exonuclease PolX [Pyrinomonadaceae bacterium]|nr:DNA polymerase/3'-5' exonuclease PolX [Pyrinomonadaceae bacterium]
MDKKLDKFAIAAALQEISALLELKGGVNRFKARAYQTGARAVAAIAGDIGRALSENRLTSIPGIGNALASQIRQLHLTGTSSVLDKLKQEFPPGIIELSRLPGLSTSKIAKLHEALGVTSITELQAAAAAGKVRNVPGFGAKTEQGLLEAIADHERDHKKQKRLHLHHAERVADQVLSYLGTSKDLQEVSIAGSLRRGQETVGVIRLVASSKNPVAVLKHLLRFPLIIKVAEQSDSSCSLELGEGATVSLRAVKPNQFGLALFWETGSEAHLTKIHDIANRKGLALDRETLKLSIKTNGKAKSLQSRKRPLQLRTEAELYPLLGMQHIAPELREDEGEIEAALKKTLPAELVSLADIKGMIHCHTTYSDGKHSVAEMAHAAEAMGMQYLTITDHSPTASYAGGLKLDRLKRQWEEIDETQEQVKIKLLKGTESDILADGRLDYPDQILERFDVVIASIHSRYKMDAEKMTKCLMTAMRQPIFKIWGHALGRLIQRRPPFACDVERILDVIAESRAAIEVNGDPYRLDMEPRWIREARKRKIKFVISVDAHSMGAMNNLKYGVTMARRGWLQKSEVLNTLSVAKFRQAVRPA